MTSDQNGCISTQTEHPYIIVEHEFVFADQQFTESQNRQGGHSGSFASDGEGPWCCCLLVGQDSGSRRTLGSIRWPNKLEATVFRIRVDVKGLAVPGLRFPSFLQPLSGHQYRSVLAQLRTHWAPIEDGSVAPDPRLLLQLPDGCRLASPEGPEIDYDPQARGRSGTLRILGPPVCHREDSRGHRSHNRRR